jgi:hypothetical protein
MTKTATAAQANEPANPPVAKIRVGLITASIWGRQTEKGRFFAVSFERRYKTQQGEWQTSHSYDPGDLLELAKAADLAHTKILELRAAETGDE